MISNYVDILLHIYVAICILILSFIKKKVHPVLKERDEGTDLQHLLSKPLPLIMCSSGRVLGIGVSLLIYSPASKNLILVSRVNDFFFSL